jgi:hypothetical protein
VLKLFVEAVENGIGLESGQKVFRVSAARAWAPPMATLSF